jgi:NAD(P)-dependent dehydrogenase (short-subunit alcohol dehydrogenase family)
MNPIAGRAADFDPPPCIVAGVGTALGETIAAGLAQRGASVALISDCAGADRPEITRFLGSFSTRADVGRLLVSAARHVGDVGLIVIACIPTALQRTTRFEEIEQETWSASMHGSMYSMIYCLQESHALLRGRGGTIVGIGPSMALVGAAGLGPLAMLAEAQRALAKSAARQWGGDNIRVHWMALGEPSLFADIDVTKLPPVPELGPPPPALGRHPGIDEVAALLELLGSRAARGLTGALLNVDGGDWMVP